MFSAQLFPRKAKAARARDRLIVASFENGRRFPSLGMASEIAEKLGEHPPTWVSVAIEEMLRKEGLNFKVMLAG